MFKFQHSQINQQFEQLAELLTKISHGLCFIKINVGKMHLTVHLQLKLYAASKKTGKYSTNTFTRQSKWLLDVLEHVNLPHTQTKNNKPKEAHSSIP